MEKQKASYQLKLTETELLAFVYHQDPFSGYGSANELQQARIRLILAQKGFVHLESYRFGSFIRLIVLNDLSLPVRYSIDRNGDYTKELIPTA
jgi:hypothetical protein